MEIGVQPLVDKRLEEQRRNIQRRLDRFELRISRQLKDLQSSNIEGVKAKIIKI